MGWGYHVGLPSASQPPVGLQCFSYDGIGDASFCGAPISRGKKMCVKFKCEVTLHASKPKVSVTTFGSHNDQVFIEVPPAAGKADVSTAVYLQPSLPADAFGTRLMEYLQEKRTLDQWTSLFASLEATPNPMYEEEAILVSRFEQPLPPNAFTPRFKHQGKCKTSSPSVDDEEDFTYLETGLERNIPVDLGADEGGSK